MDELNRFRRAVMGIVSQGRPCVDSRGTPRYVHYNGRELLRSACAHDPEWPYMETAEWDSIPLDEVSPIYDQGHLCSWNELNTLHDAWASAVAEGWTELSSEKPPNAEHHQPEYLELLNLFWDFIHCDIRKAQIVKRTKEVCRGRAA